MSETAKTEGVVLYHYWRSSASWRVRWALAIKGVAFEKVALNITEGQQMSDEHRARNPIGHVPALHVDGRTLAESVAIVEYLDETRPEPWLYPRDAWMRARCRQAVEIVNSGVQPLQNLVVLAKVGDDPEKRKEWVAFFVTRALKALEGLYETIAREGGFEGAAPGFVFGEKQALTAAEIFLVPQCYAARRFGVDPAAFPRVYAAEQAALKTEHAEGARPENQPDAPKA